jgi:hypothetical protein
VGKVPWYNPRNNGNVTIEPAIQSLLSKWVQGNKKRQDLNYRAEPFGSALFV